MVVVVGGVIVGGVGGIVVSGTSVVVVTTHSPRRFLARCKS